MAINIGNKKCQIYIGNTKVSKIYLGSSKIYSSGSTCTYICDGNTYQEEVDGGESCLSPKTFTPEKSGWKFAGWTLDTNAGEDIADKIMNELYMEGDELTLYAVFKQDIILTTVSGGVSTSNCKQAYYNNGNLSYPKFTISNPVITDATFKGWSKSSNSTSIAYTTISNLILTSSTTLYCVKQWNDAVLINTGNTEGKLYCFASGYFNSSDSDAGIINNGYKLVGPSTKYSSYRVTAGSGALDGYANNTTTGYVYISARLNKVIMRAWRSPSSVKYDEISGYPSYNGKIVTLTVPAINNSLYFNVINGSEYGPGDAKSSLNLTSVVGIGATVVG